LAYLRQKSLPQFDKFIDTAAKLAMARGWQLYLVGGAVRDLILDHLNAGNNAVDLADYLQLTDLDFVVDGFDRVADEAAGVELAKELNEIYPKARLEIHGKFQTAALQWEKDDIFDSLWVDIATARTEFYPYPAANPEVEASSIQQDLYRRDFTINALALCLSGSQAGKVLDFFSGMEDLINRNICVLHANSFIEDPTRIYRATRFATRLNFQIESRTRDYIKYAIDSNIYDRIMNSNRKVPALQTRLKAELKYMLEKDYWFAALCQLNQLNALTCLSPELTLNRRTIVRLRYSNFILQEWQEMQDRLPPSRRNEKIPLSWQFRLEILLNSLSPSERDRVAKNLQLPEETSERMKNLESFLKEFNSLEPIPSQITIFANS
jgi:tRNA nucleotidyltransferase (CCA-adding enzyme)